MKAVRHQIFNAIQGRQSCKEVLAKAIASTELQLDQQAVVSLQMIVLLRLNMLIRLNWVIKNHRKPTQQTLSECLSAQDVLLAMKQPLE